jgi:hypothetical protein
MRLTTAATTKDDKAIKSLEERENENRIDNDDNNDME